MALFLAEFNYTYPKGLINEPYSIAPIQCISRLVKAHTEKQAMQKAQQWWDSTYSKANTDSLSESPTERLAAKTKLIGIQVHPTID